jgi:hypothetical protein
MLRVPVWMRKIGSSEDVMNAMIASLGGTAGATRWQQKA